MASDCIPAAAVRRVERRARSRPERRAADIERMTTATPPTPQRDRMDVPQSPSLAAYLYANDFSLHELLENYPALEISDVTPSLRLARGVAAEYDAD